MSSRYPSLPSVHELPIALAPAGGDGATGIRLLLDHARRRGRLRRAMPLPEGRLRYMLRCLRGLPRQAAWLRLVDGSKAMRAAAEANPRLYERWQSHYLSRRLDLQARARIIEAHYRFVSREFPERLRQRLLKGHDVRLATLPLGAGHMAYLHARAPESEHCGELGLFLLNGDKEVISSCALTFGGAEGVFIGALRGPWDYLGRGAVTDFMRATGGVNPRGLLLSVVRALSTFYGIDRLRGVSAAAHPLHRREGVTQGAYDHFWRRHGGYYGADGCYELPPHATTTGRAAAEAFRRDVCEVVLKAFQKS